MDSNQKLAKQNEQQPQPTISINDETTRYLWNLAQKSNLTVTTAMPTKLQNFVKQEIKENDPVERKSQNSNITKTLNLKEAVKMNWKDRKVDKNENSNDVPASNPNPFAALPLSLIKNGILSVTSDSACVKIENGVPILKETTESCMQPCCQQKSAITIEPVLSKTRPIVAVPKMGIRQHADQVKIDETKTTTAENSINVHNSQFQRKMLLQQQILKSIFKPTGIRPLPTNSLIPNTNQMEFAALLGLELVTKFCLSEYKPSTKLIRPSFCAQCGSDFSPRWHNDVSGSSFGQKLCERCYFWHMRLKHTEDRTKHYQMQAVNLRKGLKLPSPRIAPQIALEPQQIFKNYLNTLMGFSLTAHDSIGFSDLTKLGASIAGNQEVYKAMENLRSLNRTAGNSTPETPEKRAKAIQNLQLAFYKEISEALKISDLKSQQQDTILRRCQLIVAQLANKAEQGQSAQAAQRRTAPLEVFERAIKEHKQRLLKAVQNTKN